MERQPSNYKSFWGRNLGTRVNFWGGSRLAPQWDEQKRTVDESQWRKNGIRLGGLSSQGHEIPLD